MTGAGQGEPVEEWSPRRPAVHTLQDWFSAAGWVEGGARGADRDADAGHGAMAGLWQSTATRWRARWLVASRRGDDGGR